MLSILLVTIRPEALHPFTRVLSSDPEVRIEQAASGAEAVNVVRERAPHLVIVDFELPDTQPLSLVRDLVVVNALTNTAVVSRQSEQEFHDASEGLGVLGRLPLEPDAEDAKELLQKLRQVLGG